MTLDKILWILIRHLQQHKLSLWFHWCKAAHDVHITYYDSTLLLVYLVHCQGSDVPRIVNEIHTTTERTMEWSIITDEVGVGWNVLKHFTSPPPCTSYLKSECVSGTSCWTMQEEPYQVIRINTNKNTNTYIFMSPYICQTKLPLSWSPTPWFLAHSQLHYTPHSGNCWQLLKILIFHMYSLWRLTLYIRGFFLFVTDTLRKAFVILQLYWWLFSSTKHCSWNMV